MSNNSTRSIIELWKAGTKKTEMEKITGISRRTIGRIIERYKDSGGTPEKEDIVEVIGLTPDDTIDGEDILNKMIEAQGSIVESITKRYDQHIKIHDDKPIAIGLLSDLHLGNKYVDYKAIKEEAEIIADTDGFYAFGMGDYHDNWIGKLEGIQREMPISFSSELALLEWFFDTLRDDLLVVVGGNHDTGRTKRISGIDYVKKLLKGITTLYDPDEVRFTLHLGDAKWRFKCRHLWMGTSAYNDTHGIEKDPRFGDDEFDVGIGGHTHRGTLFREFMFHHKKRLAILLGTYKYHDSYATRLGFPQSPKNSASGALILFPDGRMRTEDSIFEAAEYLKFLRS